MEGFLKLKSHCYEKWFLGQCFLLGWGGRRPQKNPPFPAGFLKTKRLWISL